MAFFLRPQPVCEIDDAALRSFASREPDLNAWLFFGVASEPFTAGV